MDPILRDLAAEFSERVVFAKVDVQNNSDLSDQFNIWRIPTIVFFREGKEWDRVSGVRNRKDLRKILEKLSS
jgi:thioredoxin 1